MAHVAKYKRGAVAPMVGHYNRTAERDGFARANIDPERTPDNYAVGFGTRDPDALALAVRGRIARAVDEHKENAGRAVRDDAVLMCDWVVTLPADCPRDDAPAFFAAAVAFAQERYGAENVPGGFVHMDESTPHAHIPVVPVAGGKLQASKVVNRADLQTFHRDLGRAVDAALGYHVSVELPDERRGAKELSRLGQKEYAAAKDELARLEQERAALAADVAGMRDQRDEIARKTAEESERLESLQHAVEERESAVAAARIVAEGAGGRELGRRADEARSRIAELEREMPGVRSRLEALERRVADAISKVQAVPDTLSDAAQAIARRLGVRILEPVTFAQRTGRAVTMTMVREQLRRQGVDERKPPERPRTGAAKPDEERSRAHVARRPGRGRGGRGIDR